MRVWNDPPTPTRREVLWIAEGKKCHWCGQPTRLCLEVAEDQATVEHIIPRGKGGTDNPKNLASACHKCNQRRAYESQMNLPDGKLLGVYPVTSGQRRIYGLPKTNNPATKPKYVALTGDEKKAIVHGGKKSTEEVLREQRDQALVEITALRKELEKKSISYATLENQLKTMTIWKLIRKRLAEWVSPK